MINVFIAYVRNLNIMKILQILSKNQVMWFSKLRFTGFNLPLVKEILDRLKSNILKMVLILKVHCEMVLLNN